MHMKVYRQKLSKESEAAIEKLVGRDINSILSPWCDLHYNSSIIELSHLSIQLGPREFFILENDWDDTPIEYHDYYFLEASIKPQPLDIKVKDEGNKSFTFIVSHMTLRLGGNSKVIKVSILEDEYKGSKETVLYDAGLVIEQENGNKIAIVRQESISGFLEIAQSNNDIDLLTKNLRIRCKFNA